MNKGKTQKNDSKKNKVIEAAIKLFSEQGYHKTAVSEIADKAGVAKGTVYWHFESKEQLFWGVVVSGVKSLNKKLAEQASKNDKSPKEKLEKIISLHLNFFKNSKQVAKMMQDSSVSTNEYFHKEMKKTGEEAIENLAKVIEEGQNKGVFRNGIDAKEGARFIIGALYGSYNPHSYKIKDVEEKVNIILDILYKGIERN
ncbi:MAG: TetR/AcrR family transcriptional regulator [Bacillota bacterium]